MIHKILSNKILTIGPDYINHRGGIGAVIEIYSKYFENFKFLASFKVGSALHKLIFFFVFIFKLFWKLIFDRWIKIIHIHGASYGSFIRKFICFIIAKYIFRKKVIYHIHGAEYHLFHSRSNGFIKKMVQIFINNVDYIICLSTAWKSFFETNFNPNKIEIVPNIIDYPSLSSIEREKKILTFLFLGIIGNRKGVFDLLEVISANKEKYSGKIKLVIGGNGETDRLTEIIKKQKLESLVNFVGWITNDEKNAWLQRADIYILPSYNEGLPISILEAMSYGQAIISTKVGGIPEIVIPNENGILIEPGNSQQLESAINFFIENHHLVDNYGEKSKFLVKKHLPDSVLKKLNSIYETLLKDE